MSVILWIVAVLLGIWVFALLLLLGIRAGVEAVGVNGEVSVEVRYGVVRIPVWPRPPCWILTPSP